MGVFPSNFCSYREYLGTTRMRRLAGTNLIGALLGGSWRISRPTHAHDIAVWGLQSTNLRPATIAHYRPISQAHLPVVLHLLLKSVRFAGRYHAGVVT